MHLNSYRIQNYRRLRDVHVALASDISIFVGSNNSGKTSATQAIQMFLSGRKDEFSLFDFSSYTWKLLNEIGAADPAGDATATIPSIVLDLWFEIAEDDLHLALQILPSSKWEGKEVGVRIEFGARNVPEMLARYRETKAEALKQVEALGEAKGTYVAWPKTLSDFLERELHHEFELRYFVLDRAQFNLGYVESAEYVPTVIKADADGGGGAILKSLVRIDCLHAQRHLADASSGTTGGAGRAEDLSRRLSRFYKRNLQQRPDDHTALKALFDSEESLNNHLMDVFKPTLERLAKLGYPGMHNPRLEISSGLNPATVMSQDAKVNYVLGDGAALNLPDSYNGLGFKNLIYMVVELLDAQEKWRLDENRAPLHLIFVEEPEAHLHAQLQQVFIRNVLDLLKIEGEVGSAFSSQVVITTHSPHILYERGFEPIRYFRRHVTAGEQTTQVVNLSTFQAGDGAKDRDFLQRYLKLTHCDLFFADAAILVEGNVERLLMPLMIEKEAKKLRSAALSILEVGGAFGHRFRELIRFLGITTLIITDLDSVEAVDAAAEDPDGDDEEELKEFELPGEDEGDPATQKYGRSCEPVAGTVTANQTLIQWLPKKWTVDELWEATAESKAEPIPGTDNGHVRVAYQVPTNVTWAGTSESLCGRTLEVSFGLENAEWCQDAARKSVGLKARKVPASPKALATSLHKRVKAQHFDKTKFALGVLTRKEEEWVVPLYIKEGLHWLQSLVDLEVTQEVKAAAEGAAAGAADNHGDAEPVGL
ncbi:MAG: ATP-dependent endonuclease [Alphaproteobacteria bacterium]|nr:ATP-dependent endonuclease [Alphaproteobacteria bacterium]MBU1514448.1 ATP-dependent endonuclease [Alphaproteobacteria bacterium]MBU2096071.1 ATP-dependent endonuclease [Alphaproteobacteria bacterium]MBU2153213.1 ATP-dependent endonuclease [Alphaproteobacteria bacterium]MBU2305554.1 ATP-dependent endonuclease [Alphaproteobacteria bacterium]